MAQKYASLQNLIESENDARQYFDSLPAYIRDQISSRSNSVNSFESLQDYAENLLRGDD